MTLPSAQGFPFSSPASKGGSDTFPKCKSVLKLDSVLLHIRQFSTMHAPVQYNIIIIEDCEGCWMPRGRTTVIGVLAAQARGPGFDSRRRQLLAFYSDSPRKPVCAKNSKLINCS